MTHKHLWESLIAAAPDLLEALELLADKARTWHDSECAVPFGACDCRADEEDKAVQIALAAIAKAKGE